MFYQEVSVPIGPCILNLLNNYYASFFQVIYYILHCKPTAYVLQNKLQWNVLENNKGLLSQKDPSAKINGDLVWNESSYLTVEPKLAKFYPLDVL